jgi:peptidoglycan-N-acetylglucosamine deacetylase
MKKDVMSIGRRRALRVGACLGGGAVLGMLGPERSGARRADLAPEPSPPAAGPGPAPGPPGHAVPGPSARPGAAAPGRQGPLSAYRLRPMTAEQPLTVRARAAHPSPSRRAAPQVRTEPHYTLPQVGNAIVLSFDDGPDPTYTPRLLDTLREHDVRATFFVCGEMVSYWPDLVRRAVDEGHVIGNHTWTHPELPKLPPGRIRSEMGRTSEIVERTTGHAPVWFRAPYGWWNRDTFEIGAEMGMEPLAWTVDTNDWQKPGTRSIVRAVEQGIGPGRVFLSHDGGGNRSQTVRAVRTYLPALAARGCATALPRL